MNWKDFFYFTRKERMGILILICIIEGISIGKIVFESKKNVELESLTHTQPENDRLNKKIQEIDKNTSDNIHLPVQLTGFDPNVADSVAFLSLGISPFVTKNILNYRRKGGRFRKPDDLSKIYGMEEELFATLKPFIEIAHTENKIQPGKAPEKEEFKPKPPSIPEKRIPKQEKLSPGETVGLNTADSTELKKIPGIGSGFAKRITGYRKLLGGFYSVEQLKEIYGITDELFRQIAPYFVHEDTFPILQVSVNTASIEKMRIHPYINFHQAKAIVEIREKRGKIKSISELVLLDEFPEQEIQRLIPYLSFD